MFKQQHQFSEGEKPLKTQQRKTVQKVELIVFRLKRDLADEQKDIIMLEDRPRKRPRFNQSVGKLTELFGSFSLVKENSQKTQKTNVVSQNEPKHDKRFLKRLTQEALNKENGFSFLTQKLHEDKRKNLRNELLSIFRGKAHDNSLVKVCEINKDKFMIINGQQVPFKNIAGDKFQQDLYIVDRNPAVNNIQNYPVLQYPEELAEIQIDSDGNEKYQEESPVDSEDSNAEDHADNDYPDQQDEMNKLSDQQNNADEIYRDYNCNEADDQENIGFQEDFYQRFINKKKFQTKQKRYYDEDDNDDDSDF